MKCIAVYMSAGDIAEVYRTAALDFVSLMVKDEYGLVFGASDNGLMKIVADEVTRLGGYKIGIQATVVGSPPQADLDEHICTDDIFERKKIFKEKSDAFIALPGGMGTLDEIVDIAEQKKHGLDVPIVLLNTSGFYDSLKAQLKRMEEEGFLRMPTEDLMYFADTPQDAIDYINKSLQS